MTSVRHIGFGALAFAVVESIWLLGHFALGFPSRWVLEPTSGIVFCSLALTVSASVVAATRKVESSWLLIFAQMGVGAYAAVVVALFCLGSGNLWPIVLLIDAVLVFPMLFAGALLGDLVRDIRGHAA